MIPILTDHAGRALDVGATHHHLLAFRAGGPTSEANGALLCGRHHRYVHAHGWHGHITDGHVRWRPPHSDEDHTNAHHQHLERLIRDLAHRWLARNPQLIDTG